MREERGRDMIEITKKQLDLIMAWRDKNKDLVRNFLPFIMNGIIRIKDGSSSNEISFMIFKGNEENVYMGMFDYFFIDGNGKNYHLILYAGIIREGKTFIKESIKGKDYDTFYKKEQESDLMQDINAVFFAVNAYFFHYREDEEEIPVKEVKKHGKKKGKSDSKEYKPSSVCYLSTKYRLKGVVRQEKIPKTRQWHVDYWGVRGHLRHYKSGKTIFIAPYMKGKDRENAVGKTKVYKV